MLLAFNMGVLSAFFFVCSPSAKKLEEHET